MDLNLNSMSPFELGELGTKDTIPYLVVYLNNGTENDKRLAASAVQKLLNNHVNCDEVIPFLIKNLKSEKPQTRQYTIKCLSRFYLEEQFYEVIVDCYNHEDKDYNTKILYDLLQKFEKYSEIDIVIQNVFQNIKQNNPDIVASDIEQSAGSDNELPLNPENKKGYIYFIKEDFSNTVKIGKTNNLKERMANFGVKLPFNIELIHSIKTNNALYTEKLFHLHFSEKKTNGEWFKLDENDIYWIKSGNYTKKINDSLHYSNNKNPSVSSKVQVPSITIKQKAYLSNVLEQNQFMLHKPIQHLTMQEASDIIAFLTSGNTNIPNETYRLINFNVDNFQKSFI